MQNKRKKIEETLDIVKNDNESLCRLILRVRDMGMWDLEDLTFRKETYNQIFGLYPHLPG